MSYSSFLSIATKGKVVRRSLIVAAIVGSLLVVINHGGCILSGGFDTGCWVRSLLSVVVPYLVSTVSSVLSELERN